MPIVTLNANDPANPKPNPVPCTDKDQAITWKLVPSLAAFADPPIFFPNPPPAGYSRWPGGPVSVNVGTNTATAQVNKKIGVGPKETYKYSVVLANGTTIDPEVENTGSGMGEGPGKRPNR